MARTRPKGSTYSLTPQALAAQQRNQIACRVDDKTYLWIYDQARQRGISPSAMMRAIISSAMEVDPDAQ